jgi:hypothetical protein
VVENEARVLLQMALAVYSDRQHVNKLNVIQVRFCPLNLHPDLHWISWGGEGSIKWIGPMGSTYLQHGFSPLKRDRKFALKGASTW